MKKLINRTLLFLLLVWLTLVAKVVYYDFDTIKSGGFSYMPLNNLSNSVSLRAKLDHMVKHQKFKYSEVLIVGSSMAMNNISGEVIAKTQDKVVYNIGSWGIKPNQIYDFLKTMQLKPVNCVIMPFNNTDFGEDKSKIDYSAIHQQLYGNVFNRFFNFFYYNNINTFLNDWNYRFKNKHNHTYESLNFDDYGTVLMEKKDFVIDSGRWHKNFGQKDFDYFYRGIKSIDSLCKRNRIRFILAYLPNRPGFIQGKDRLLNDLHAKELSLILRKNFIDLRFCPIAAGDFCDAYHVFKPGAIQITNALLDSMRAKGLN